MQATLRLVLPVSATHAKSTRMGGLAPMFLVKQVATGVHVDGGTTVLSGLV